MPYTVVRGIRVHHLTEGQGPDVIMIHGFLENLAVWHLGLAPIVRDEVRLTTYDLRGHGRSDLSSRGYTPDALAADLEALMDGLGIGRAVLVGRSFGADVALHAAVRSPDRVAGLVAIEPALVGGLSRPGDEAWGGWRYWGGLLAEAGVAVPAERRTDLPFLLEQAVMTSAFDGPFPAGPRKRDRLLRLIRETALVAESGEVFGLTRDVVRGIRQPVLLVYGGRSPFLASLAFLRGALRRSRTLIVPDAEHLTPWDRARLIGDEILRFVRRLGRGRAGAGGPRPPMNPALVEAPGR